MKIIGPIAGTGTRLRPFTFKKPKAFIKVAGKPVLDHILNKLKETFDTGTELILIVSYKKEQIIDYISKNYSKDFKLTFIEQ
ncbi:MAG: 2-C-methyl-D-erythritol 4-phosphate cytidylyltransferase, partial [Candidatus Lokiarchaeota archaeon]|nr:2-C-methyl-D-erythritol 4-phosphate cytidylyltransferase [Candidatus Lokiarchaeota archaeon]